jgi:hypothetical protein
MQAKDIDDAVFLAAVVSVQVAQMEKRRTDYRPWALWGFAGMEPSTPYHEQYGPFVLDHFPDVPWKVLRAKGQRLIDRGLLDGCMCGCRGDMAVTEAGLRFLATVPGP